MRRGVVGASKRPSAFPARADAQRGAPCGSLLEYRARRVLVPLAQQRQRTARLVRELVEQRRARALGTWRRLCLAVLGAGLSPFSAWARPPAWRLRGRGRCAAPR